MSYTCYDVLAVDLVTRKVRVMARDQESADADAIIKMAVARRGVDKEFFVAAPRTVYVDGDNWLKQ